MFRAEWLIDKVLPKAGFVLCMFAAVPAGAEPAVYTIEDCVRIGLERSTAAANARRDETIAGAVIRQTVADVMPQLSLKASYTRLDEVQEATIGDETVEFGILDNYSATAEISQLLFSGGRASSAIKAAGLGRSFAQYGRAEADSTVVRDIRIGFHDILLAKAAVKVREESVRQFTAFLEQTKQKYENGAASEFDLLSARVKLANDRPNLIRARNAHQIAMANFSRLLSMDNEDFDVAGALTYKPVEGELDVFREQALRKRAALRQEEAGVRLREQDVAATSSDYWPTLRAFFAYSGANNYGIAAFEDEWEQHWNTGATFEWNLWDGGLTRGQVAEKRLQLEKARANLDELTRVIKLQVRQAYLDMRSAEEAIAAAEGSVELAAKALDIAGTRHRAGLATNLEFTDANLALSAAQFARYGALHAHMNAVARLQYACGSGRQEDPPPAQ